MIILVMQPCCNYVIMVYVFIKTLCVCSLVVTSTNPLIYANTYIYYNISNNSKHEEVNKKDDIWMTF